MMKPYPAYKSSGVVWIGEIPERWEVKRLKWVLTEPLKYGANEVAELDDPANPRYIRITDFDGDGKLRDDTFKSLPTEIAKEFYLKEGDVLFARSGATVGKTFQFKNYKGKACFAGYLIKASPNENELLSDFLYNYTRSNSYDNWKNSIFNQATIQNIGADKYEVLPLVIPPLPEQHAIARYLDDKTKKIDALIEMKQRLIEFLKEQRTAIINQAVTKGINPNVPARQSAAFRHAGVKMKDSGIEWLGEIPEHWEVKRLKHCTMLVNGYAFDSNGYIADGIPIVRIGDIKSKMDLTEAKRVPKSLLHELKSFQVKKDDILLALTGATIGKSSVYDLDEPALLNQRVAIIRPSTGMQQRFLKYVIGSELFTRHIDYECFGGAQENIGKPEVGSFVLAFPPLQEQATITAFLEDHTGRIDDSVLTAEKHIALLQEYRTALISEVVTGKIDVREQVQYKELEEKEWLLAESQRRNTKQEAQMINPKG